MLVNGCYLRGVSHEHLPNSPRTTPAIDYVYIRTLLNNTKLNKILA